MRNLKKLLAVTVAIVMCFGLMTSGLAATGTDYTVYTDKDQIDSKYIDAVALLSALDILAGVEKEDGTRAFTPKGEVTRGQMAKMLYVVLNNGYDDKATLYLDDATTLTDISGHWAEGYIKYCFTTQIIAGFGDGTFKPDANVTGLQAFKMCLVALGFDPIKEGLVGAKWASNTGICAQGAQLTDRVEDVDARSAIVREVAAQIMANMLDATLVHYVNGVRQNRLGDDTFTPLTFAVEKLGLKTLEAVLVANDQVSLNSTHTTDTFSVCEDNESTFEYKVDNTASSSSSSAYQSITVKVDTPYTLVGKAVKVYVKVKAGVQRSSYNWVSGIEKVFGNVVEVPGMNIVTNTTIEDYSTDNFKTSGNLTQFYVNYTNGIPNYTNDTVTPFYPAGGTYKDAKANFDGYYNGTFAFERDKTNNKYGKGQQVILISNDGNKSVEYVLAFDKRFGEITSYSGDRLSITKNDESNYSTGFYNVKFEDIYDVANYALGDQVLMWEIPETEMFMLEKATELKGTMSGSAGSSSSPKAIIGGTQYTIARDHIAYDDVIASDFVGKELTYYLDGKQICGVNSKGVTKASDNYLVVTGSRAEGIYGDGIDKPKYTASVLTSSGKRDVYEIDAVYTTSGGSKLTMTDSAGNGMSTSVASGASKTLNGFEVYINNLVTAANATSARVGIDDIVFKYSLSSGNKLTLYAPDCYGYDVTRDYEKGAAAVITNVPSKATMALNSTSVAFLKSKSPNTDGYYWFLYSGNSNIASFAKTLNDVDLQHSFSGVYGKASSKDDMFKAFGLKTNKDITGSTDKFGLIIDSYTEVIGGVWYYKNVTLFDGTSVQKYTCEANVRVDNSGLTRGDLVNAGRGRIVKFELGGGLISEMNAVDLLSYKPYDETSPNFGFHAGYITSDDNGNGFGFAEEIVGGVKVGSMQYLMKSDAKVIWLNEDYKTDDIDNSYKILTKAIASKEITERISDPTAIEPQTHNYSAIVREDASNVGYAKTVYIFEDIIEDENSGDDFYNKIAQAAIPSSATSLLSNDTIVSEVLAGANIPEEFEVDASKLPAGVRVLNMVVEAAAPAGYVNLGTQTTAAATRTVDYLNTAPGAIVKKADTAVTVTVTYYYTPLLAQWLATNPGKTVANAPDEVKNIAAPDYVPYYEVNREYTLYRIIGTQANIEAALAAENVKGTAATLAVSLSNAGTMTPADPTMTLQTYQKIYGDAEVVSGWMFDSADDSTIVNASTVRELLNNDLTEYINDYGDILTLAADADGVKLSAWNVASAATATVAANQASIKIDSLPAIGVALTTARSAADIATANGAAFEFELYKIVTLGGNDFVVTSGTMGINLSFTIA